jgi:AraC family transcriptional regulator of adaptative response / DNA-3-methyladenine glycosylase II
MDTDTIAKLKLDRAALDRARISRDARFDGRFFIGVRSTRIYCRPICPAPSPKPGNIRYFSTAAAAAEAGFRPCLRCRPEAAPASPAWLGVSAVVRRALRLIEEGALDEASVTELAARLGIGERHLRRLFVQHVGAAPLAVAQTRRLHFAKRLIDETNLSMTEVALASGYGSVRRFNAAFRSTYGRAPTDLRRRGRAAKPRDGIVLRLSFRPPYDWPGMLQFLAARAVAGMELVEGNRYLRTIEVGEKPASIAVGRANGMDALEFEVRGVAPVALFNLVARARRMFDLSLDPVRLDLAYGRDRLLAPLAARYQGLRIPGVWDGFEGAVRAVLHEGSIEREQTLVARLVRSCGARLKAADLRVASLTRLFPTARAVAAADLAADGFSQSQILRLRALAAAVADGSIDFNAPSDEFMRALVRVQGIDESTAHYIALRALGEPDAFPADDPVLQRQARLYRGAQSLADVAKAWRPWRAYAALMLWRADAERHPGVTTTARSPISRRPRRGGDERSVSSPDPRTNLPVGAD